MKAKEEPKQETIEEAAERYAHNYFNMHETNNYKALKQGYEAGAKEMAERMYSDEEVYDLLVEWTAYQNGFPRVDEDEIPNGFMSFNQWFEQNKKK